MRYGLHIGINEVNPLFYNGWVGKLYGCVNDAIDLSTLINAESKRLLINEMASISIFISAISDIANKSTPDDTTYITYSGHGGQITDINNDESDKLDETWCLYNGEIIDDLIFKLINSIKGKVIVLSDSCHSGSITRAISLNDVRRIKQKPKGIESESISLNLGTLPDNKPNVLTLSGCQDFQVSYDGTKNGLFTESILTTLHKNRDIDYIELITRSRSLIGNSQYPKLTFRNGKGILKNKVFV